MELQESVPQNTFIQFSHAVIYRSRSSTWTSSGIGLSIVTINRHAQPMTWKAYDCQGLRQLKNKTFYGTTKLSLYGMPE